MGTHYNPSISERYVRTFNPKFDYNAETISDVIQPTVEIRPISLICRNANSTVTGNTVILTTQSDKDFYITSISLGYEKDVACDGVVASVTATIQGVIRTLLELRGITLTASRDSISISYPYPVKIDRNVSINVSNSFGAGNMVKFATLTGYYEEVTKSQ